MSHEITIRDDGFAEAAYNMTPAWHGLGKVYDEPMTSLEALEGAGLDWAVEQKDVFQKHEVDPSQSLITSWHEQVPGFQLNLRSDTGALLGMVSEHYKVVQNTEAFQFLDQLVEDHQMMYESAFSLRGGKKVVLLAKMPGARVVVEGDHLLDYVVLSLGHDGTEAVLFGPTSVRVVCANTYAMALYEGHTRGLSIRHSGNIKEKLSQARGILSLANKQFARYAEIGKTLAQRRLSKEEWTIYLDLLCPELDPLDPNHTDRRAEKVIDTRHNISVAFRNERQDTAPESAWVAFQAVAEVVDHLPRKGRGVLAKAEARFNTCLSGVGQDLKERAFQAACNVAGISSAA